MENVQDSCQSLQDCTPQKIHPKVRLSQSSEKLQTSKSYILGSTGLCEDVKVYHGTIKKRLNMGVLFVRVSLNKSQDFWTVSFSPKWRFLAIILGTKFSESQTKHISSNSSYQLSSMGIEGCWFGLILQTQDSGTLQTLITNSSVY